MSDVIFQTTTCLKQDIFPTFIQILKGAGWKDISSDHVTDFAIMQSTGEDEGRDLVFQIRPTSITNTNDTTTTDYNVMSLRLISGYTPGEPGMPGTVERPSEVWRTFYIAPTTTQINRENEMKITYHANKNRVIFIMETPDSLGFAPVTQYIGLPEAFINEPKSKGLVWAASCYAGAGTGVMITDSAEGLPPLALSAARTGYIQLPPISPNSAGKHTPVSLKYGIAAEGWRGKLDGIYMLPINAVSNGDVLSIGNRTFRGVVNGAAGNNSFGTTTLVIQMS